MTLADEATRLANVAGYLSYATGLVRDANPYLRGRSPRLHAEWLRGFDAAAIDSKVVPLHGGRDEADVP